MGIRQHPLYGTYSNIMSRTTNPRVRSYADYGARGIRIAEEWQGKPRAFIAWMEENLGSRPEGMTLDRIDNDGNYEPGNLRWASASEQHRNRRRAWASRVGAIDRPNGRWRVRIRIGGQRRIQIGTFDTEDEAREALASYLRENPELSPKS